ncbi:MAG: TIGR03617 family F420-dependent LLM class oxidoreductase [Acidimicrobiales bacterium]|nr:TIGR03617 family F420-dependent LLM class oxidoreductase [Acidimicrobiales bacterium]|tara:strand:+ start:126 stop:1175 length:1050 start_codon:yes stop_codon:yes gene_type:complete
MKVYTTFPQANLKDIPDAVSEIEADGYDGIVALENRHDPFLPLAVAALHSERLELATGVAIAFPRSPMIAANVGWDLQQASSGRFELGLGSQVRGHNERRFSVAWSPPAPRMKEYVEAVKAIWDAWVTGAPLNYRGDFYNFTLMTPNFTPEALTGPPPKITMAAVGPAMLRTAGRTCDGVRLHAFCTREYLESSILPQVGTGLLEGGKTREKFQISGGGFVCTGPDDESVTQMMDWVRYRIGFYGSTKAYWPVLEQHDLLDLGEELNYLSKNDGWDKMASRISDDVVRQFAAVGRHDEIATVIEERFGGLIDAIGASASPEIPADLPREVIQDIQRIATPYQAPPQSTL